MNSSFEHPVLAQEGRDISIHDADPDLLAALNDVVHLSGSDLHISVGSIPMVRVDGSLRPGLRPVAWQLSKVVAAFNSILTEPQRQVFRDELELDFAYTVSQQTRFRVNLYRQRGSVAGAFRLIPTVIKSLAELELPPVVAKFADLKRGLVLVTGSTGSGKSTTIAALLDLVNRTRPGHIVTIEDPIEFLHPDKMSRVNQREVGHDTLSFAGALKRVLRQDPDVILIGELRDRETISVALTAAETGHLVFASLHTQNATQTIDRIIDVFPSDQQAQIRSQLASTLRGVICQTLVVRANGRGRVVASEVMVMTPAVANLIREGKGFLIPTAMQVGHAFGMQTLDQNLLELVNFGRISRQSAMDVSQDTPEFERMTEPTEAAGVDPAAPPGFEHELGPVSGASWQ